MFSVMLLLLLMAQRVIALLQFGDWATLHNSAQYLPAFFLRALRFDLKYLSALLLVFVWLPALIFALLPERWFSRYLHTFFKILLVLTLFVAFIDMGYLYYYQKTIDVLIFGFINDDTSAILAVILDNPLLVLLFAGFLLTAFILLRIFSRYSDRANQTHGHSQDRHALLAWLFSLLVLALLTRGSLDTFPLQRKHASVSDSRFINSLVMNSPFNLYYSWQDFRINNQQIFKQDLLKQNGLANSRQLMTLAGYDQTHPLLRHSAASEALTTRPPHVIFVQMEGWSAYIARKHSAKNNVLGAFAKHASADHFFTQFFSNKFATNPTIENLLLNSPITPLAQSIASQTRFTISNLQPFIDQGYKTLFLSGGYSSWRNHNRFWLKQGFDQYIGRSKIEKTFQVDASDNPWGVYEEYVFKYLEQALMKADQEGKSLFSFVLTTNNHPPVRLPENFVMPSLQPEAYGFDAGDEGIKDILSGYFYQTDQIGRFLDWVKQGPLKDRIIIVATGDHPLRKFTRNTALKDQYKRNAVANYFYVPESIDRLKGIPNDIAGSHNDLFPTLFELSLPNAAYYNFGEPIMEKQYQRSYGWSARGKFIFEKGVADVDTGHFYHWRDDEKIQLNEQAEPLLAWQLDDIKKEKYRNLLKRYLLVKDYQQSNESANP